MGNCFGQALFLGGLVGSGVLGSVSWTGALRVWFPGLLLTAVLEATTGHVDNLVSSLFLAQWFISLVDRLLW